MSGTLNRSEELKKKADSSMRYQMAIKILEYIVDALEPMKKHSLEAREFWLNYMEQNGTVDVEEQRKKTGYTVEDHPMFWLGHAYGIEALIGYNAAKMAEELTVETMEAINEAIKNQG